MSTTTTNFGWTVPQSTDLVKDGATAIATLGSGIDTSFVGLKGGTTGQILSKTSNADLAYTWINNDQGDITAVTAGTGITGGGTSGAVTITNDMATTIDAKGDLIGGTGADTYARLAVGANNTVLTADSTQATGMKWATVSYNPAAFLARKTGPDQTLTTGTNTKLTFTTEDLDSNSFYDATNSKFLPTTAGYYQINCAVNWENMTATNTTRLMIYKNGAEFRRIQLAGTAGTVWGHTLITALVYCNGSTDYIEMYGYQDSGANKVVFYSVGYNWFEGFFVRS